MKDQKETKIVSEEYAAWALAFEARCNEIAARWNELNAAVEYTQKAAKERFRKLREISGRAKLHHAPQAELDQATAEIERIVAPIFRLTNAIKPIEDFFYEMKLEE